MGGFPVAGAWLAVLLSYETKAAHLRGLLIAKGGSIAWSAARFAAPAHRKASDPL